MQSGGEESTRWTGTSHPTSGNILHHSKFSQGTWQLKCIPHCFLTPLHLLSELWRSVLKFNVCEIHTHTHTQFVGRHVQKYDLYNQL